MQPSLFEVGIDVGLSEFATLSDGTKIENPKWFRKMEERLRKPNESFHEESMAVQIGTNKRKK